MSGLNWVQVSTQIEEKVSTVAFRDMILKVSRQIKLAQESSS